ncbi:hypothetical protein WME88_20135 [Sorangium sp. So ce216]
MTPVTPVTPVTPAAEPDIVDQVLAFFGFRRAKPTDLLRGAEDTPSLDVWTMNADGSSPVVRTTDGGYTSPVLCADGRIIAIHGGKLRVIGVGAEPPRGVRVADVAALFHLVACKDGKVGAFTERRDLVLVDLASGAADVLARDLSAAARSEITDASRTCEGKQVVEDWPPGTEGWSGIAIMPEGDLAHRQSLTASMPTRYNREPSFSPDCARITFVAEAPRAGAPPPVHPGQGSCHCGVPAPRPLGVGSAWIALGALLWVRRASCGRRQGNTGV